MRKFGLLSTSAISSVAFFGLSIAFAAPAYAETAAVAQPGCTPEQAAAGTCTLRTNANGQPTDQGGIVVTGTRINRPNLTSSVPITTITSQELTSTGDLSIGDRLNQLPQLTNTFSQANSTRFIGTAGINSLDLRALGTARTLVLVDGRRIVTATPAVNRPDVNNVPTDLIQRVDIVTGGDSAVYGSDAVAGVVNFILRRDFDGIRVRGQGGISSRGDRGSYFVSVTAGRNFADGRGNIAISAEYSYSDTLTNVQRDEQTGAFSGRNQFNAVENTGSNLNPSAGPLHGPEPATGNGIPDTNFLHNIRNLSISEGGAFTASCPTVAAAGESAAAFAARRAGACSGLANPGSSNPLSQFGSVYMFQPDGTLAPAGCVTDLRPFGSGNCVGGLGSSLRLTGFLVPGNERKDINILAHYEFSPAFVPFLHAQYVRSTSNQEGQPTFFNNTFSIDNPFLSAQARALIVANLAPGQTTFAAQRFNIDFGGRGERHERENYQVVAGIGGTFNDDWHYEVSFNYGHLSTYYETQGNVLLQQYANSIDAVRNGAGQIVCRINADADPTNDDPACVPVNLFGYGAPSQAALNYFGITSNRRQSASLYDGIAYVAGDSSQVFELPGGPVAFVLGGEIRRETAFAAYDDRTKAGLTFLNTIPDLAPPALVVKEAFGELHVPLLRDAPFFRELTLDASGRVSNYNLGRTGTVFAWNVSGTWAPVSDVRFRVSYARSIRAPTQGDLFAPLTQTFLNGLADPCGQQNINANPNRVRNCGTAGVPTTQTFTLGGVTTTEPFTNRPASGISGFNGSNPNLQQEEGRSFTAGVVIQPRYIPGLSISVDYYDIKVSNVIFSLSPQTIINQCYDSPSGINNQYCANVFRNPNGTFAGQSNVTHAGGTVSFATTGPSFISGPFNFAALTARGIDADISYRTSLGAGNRLTLRGILSHSFERNVYSDVTNPTFATNALYTLGEPAWQGQLSVNLEHSIFNFGYRMRYIGKQTVSAAYETQNPFQGRPPLNPDAFPFSFYPDITYHDFRIEAAPNSHYRFYVGIDNALDRLPPYDLLGTAGGDPFSPIGRFFYAGVDLHF